MRPSSRNVVSHAVQGGHPETGDVRAFRVISLRRRFVALVGLIIIFAVAFGSMIAFADILRHFYPSHRFDEFAALHNPVVLVVLVTCSAIWLLVPRPPSTRLHSARNSAARTHSGAGRHSRLTV